MRACAQFTDWRLLRLLGHQPRPLDVDQLIAFLVDVIEELDDDALKSRVGPLLGGDVTADRCATAAEKLAAAIEEIRRQPAGLNLTQAMRVHLRRTKARTKDGIEFKDASAYEQNKLIAARLKA